MAIEHNGKIIRSLPEQVAKNLTDIIKLMADITALTNLVNSKLTGAMHYKGSVATVADLPSTGNEIGDFYNVTSTGANYAWDGTQWDDIGSIVDLTPYARKDQNNTFTATNVFTGDIAVDSIYDTLNGVIFEVSDIDQKIARTGYTIFPTMDTSYDLGSPTRRWDNIYVTSSISDGTNEVGVADIVTTVNAQTITGAKSFNDKKLRIQEGTQFWTFSMDSGGSYLDIMYNGTNTVMSITRTGIISKQDIRPQSNNSIDLGTSTYNWKAAHIQELNMYFGSYQYQFKDGTFGQLYIGRSDGTNGILVDGGIIRTRGVASRSNNNYDLGSSSNKWRDLYLAGNLSDGTNSVTIADLAALITYAKAQGWIS